MSVAIQSNRPSHVATRRGRSRLWLWAAGLLALSLLLAWGGLQLAQSLWSQGDWMALNTQDFDVTVNGQPWDGHGLGDALGLVVGIAVVGILLLLALTVLLPMAVGGIVLGVLLVVGLVLGAIALPVLLVLALLLSPLLALGGLAWMLFG